MEKKFNTQITHFINNVSLVDFQDNINDTYEKNGKMIYSNKIIVVVNNYGGQNHKEKFASYYMDIEDALYLAHHIINRTFKTHVYNSYKGKKYYGVFMTFAGNKVARVFSLKYQEEKENYEVKVGLYEPIKGQNGQTSPNWQKKIDEHICYVGEEEMIRMMLALQVYIQSAMNIRLIKEQLGSLIGQATIPTPQPKQEQPKQETKPQPKKEKAEGLFDIDLDLDGSEIPISDDDLPF